MWDFESTNTKKFFGANLKKAKANHDKELKKIRDKSVKTYPYAKLSEFEFWINLSKTGDITSKTNIVYKGDGETKLYDLTGRTWRYSWDVTSDGVRQRSGTLWKLPKVLRLVRDCFPSDRSTFGFSSTEIKVFCSRPNL